MDLSLNVSPLVFAVFGVLGLAFAIAKILLADSTPRRDARGRFVARGGER